MALLSRKNTNRHGNRRGFLAYSFAFMTGDSWYYCRRYSPAVFAGARSIFMANKELLETSCIKEASKRLGFAVRTFDAHGNFFSVKAGGRDLFFANRSGPWNSDSIFKIFRDKEFTHMVFGSSVRMPRSAGFADPFYVPPGQAESLAGKQERRDAFSQIAERMAGLFCFPFVIKMNAGLKGINVFLVKSEKEAIDALEKIFDCRFRTYDYVALAQEYIKIKEEYRVVVFRKELLLIYKKGSRAVVVKDEAEKKEIADFLKPVFEALDFDFGAFDVVRETSGGLCLLEANSRPSFRGLAKGAGREALVGMYSHILSLLKEG